MLSQFLSAYIKFTVFAEKFYDHIFWFGFRLLNDSFLSQCLRAVFIFCHVRVVVRNTSLRDLRLYIVAFVVGTICCCCSSHESL